MRQLLVLSKHVLVFDIALLEQFLIFDGQVIDLLLVDGDLCLELLDRTIQFHILLISRRVHFL